MIRNLVGYAVFAVVGVVAFKVFFKLLGVAVGLFWTLMWLAFVGFVFYLILRLVSPKLADQIQEMIKGTPTT